MDSQDHRKNNLVTGPEGHAVHLCHKCGWPFPNPHPSAKHRRAHKKICGTIEGYKLLDSGETSHLTLSDDDHPSDDEHKTPGPKVLERCINEQGSGGIGNRSNRSEDEVFSDAVSEFADSGSNASIEEQFGSVKEPATKVETVSGNDAASIQSDENVASAAAVPPPSNAVDGSQKISTEASRSNLLENEEDFRDLKASATMGLTETSLTDGQTKTSIHNSSDDTAASDCDTNPIQFETCANASQENKDNAGGNMVKAYAETTEISEKCLPVTVVLPSDNIGASFEAVSKFGMRQDISSDAVPAFGVIQSKDEHDNEVDSKMSLDDCLAEVEPVEQIKAAVHSTQVNAAEGLNSVNSGNSFEAYNQMGEGQENVHVLSVPENAPIIENAEILIEGFKDHKAGKLPQFVNANLFEVINNAKDSATWDNPFIFHSSILSEGHEASASNLHMLDDKLEQKDGISEIVEDFPDEGEADFPKIKVATNQNQRLEESEASNAGTIEMENSCSIQTPEESLPCDYSNELSLKSSRENATDFLSDTIHPAATIDKEGEAHVLVLDGKLEQKEKSGKLVEELHSEEGAVVPQIEASEELEVHTDSVAVEKEKSHTLQSKEESLADDYSNGSSMKSSLEHPMVLSDVSPVVEPVDVEVTQTNILVGMHDTIEAKFERFDVAGVVKNKDITEESTTEKVVAASEPASIVSVLEVDSRANLLGGDGAAELEDSKMEEYDVFRIETGEGESISKILEENISEKTNALPESAIDIQEFSVVSNSASDASDRKILESESTKLGAVADTWEVVKEPEINGNEVLQVGGVGRIDKAAEPETGKEIEVLQCSSEAAEPETGKDIEVFQCSSKDHIIKEPLMSPLDASSSLQTSATIKDAHVRESVITSGSRSDTLPDEGDNDFVAQKLNASSTNLSIDSISQTESLEGQWGSVSVLSTQSDILPTNGFQATEEAEKTIPQKSEGASGGHHSDKSDMFEPPSFMTLVEPRDDEKAAASEIQTVQITQEQKAASLQTGWFPSLTHVNDSPGRKKNEEIIAKVTNSSTGKQHTPLKNLLGEAHDETKLKLLNAKENPVPVAQKDENTAKDNSALTMRASLVMGSEAPVSDPVKKEVGKEWNSPARYSTEIKREKRKVKGRPYWAQFVCCSSVN